MFGANKENTKKNIPILTIDHYPQREYEVLGMVTTRFDDFRALKMPDESKVEVALQKAAEAKNADAVIGARMFLYSGASIIGYGTAIKFI